ncbi:MAG: RNA polymerase sigma factor [Kiloniellales bacterium]|nr:RNA polymerase sigma factor [Kiloniellales bacterium]
MTDLTKAATDLTCLSHLYESKLVSALRAGAPGAADTLVRANAGWMTTTALRIFNNPSLAEECVQEALVNALRETSELNRRSRLRPWLHRKLASLALAQLKASRQRCREEAVIDEAFPFYRGLPCHVEETWLDYKTPSELLDQEKRRIIIQSEIAKLPENYRAILELRDLDELTTREAAKALGISEGNAKVRLHRARLVMKKKLNSLFQKGQI